MYRGAVSRLFIFRTLHKCDPVRFLALAGFVAKPRLLIGKGKNFADPNLGFVPLEDQELAWLQSAEALGEPFAEVVAPLIGEDPILEPQPAFAASFRSRRALSAEDRTPPC